MVCGGPVWRIDSGVIERAAVRGKAISERNGAVYTWRIERIVECQDEKCGAVRVQNMRVRVEDGGATVRRYVRE